MHSRSWVGEVRASSAEFGRRLAVLALLVALSRLPLIGTGYGTDTDGWSLARAARSIAEHGVYRASRMPGNPVQEFGSAAVILAGPWAVNALTALMSLAAALIFALLLRRLGARVDALAGAALAFVPVIYISSASGMDYAWGLAFLLGATLAVVLGRHALAGLLLGLAIGSRLTSAVFVLPLALMAYVPGPFSLVRRLRGPLLLATLAALVGTACFLPAYRTYGWSFLGYYEHAGGHSQGIGYFLSGLLHVFPLPFAPVLVAGQGTVGVWGLCGCLALGVALVAALARALRPRRVRDVDEDLSHDAVLRGAPGSYVFSWALAIVLVVWLYLRLPDDEGYLTPMVPFTLLLFATWLKPRAFRVLCFAMLLSPFVLGLDSVPPKKGIAPAALSAAAPELDLAGHLHLVLEPLRGPLLVDLDKRRAAEQAVAAARAAWNHLPRGAIVIAGVLAFELGDQEPERSHPHRTEDILPESEVRSLIEGGAPLFYLPGARERTARFFGYSLDSAGVQPMPKP
ncbi:MAG: hypothetical protein ACRENS_12805 [Candidatus Eiseniibacteriota bacterium]